MSFKAIIGLANYKLLRRIFYCHFVSHPPNV